MELLLSISDDIEDQKELIFEVNERLKIIQRLVVPYLPIAEISWNPGSIADGDEEAKEITIEGAALTDFALASFSLDITDLTLDAQVTAKDTITCVLANNTGGAINLKSGTLYVMVIKREE